MSKKLLAMCFTILIGTLAFTHLSFAQNIQGFTYGGEGCPRGSVGWVFDRSNNVLTLHFDEYSAWASGDYEYDNKSNSCNVSFVVRVPGGWGKGQISLNRAQYLGFVDTEDSVYAQLRRKYTYGWNTPEYKTTNFRRGKVGDFDIVDV